MSNESIKAVAPDFYDRLTSLCGPESAKATGDPERSAAMIEALASVLGRTVARVTRGDRTAIDELLHGAEALALDEAIALASLASGGTPSDTQEQPET